MMNSTCVQISAESKIILSQLALKSGMPMCKLLDNLLKNINVDKFSLKDGATSQQDVAKVVSELTKVELDSLIQYIDAKKNMSQTFFKI